MRSPGHEPAAQFCPVILSARIGEHADRTRLVIESSDPLTVHVFTLAGPDRIVIDMPEVQWRIGNPERPNGHSSIKSYRYGLFGPGDSRFVIDLSNPVSVAKPLLLKPQSGYGYRTVLDLIPTTQERYVRTTGWPAAFRPPDSERKAQGTSGSPAIASGKHIIVIDAGHGGIDSGTRGFDGEMEKEIALDEALRLGRMLEQRHYSVRYTRDSDVYVPLRERADAARADHADLFISLHADSNPDPRVSGASVYTLSQSSSDREAAALARKENQSDAMAGMRLSGESNPVASILVDLARRDTMNRSARLADSVISRLERTTDILPRTPHRSAGFVVLHTPGVPAVLIELGYLSNRGDCSRMATGKWRNRVAAAISDAVDAQFHSGSPNFGQMQAAD